ncbi:MAG: SUMF1/EgtB/PvdO family nonheme iron enzyme, partial [Phototrophicaceae bacterium]
IINGYNNGQSKVLRGGSFYDDRDLARSSFRNNYDSRNAVKSFGFRLVVAPSFATLNSGTLTSAL